MSTVGRCRPVTRSRPLLAETGVPFPAAETVLDPVDPGRAGPGWRPDRSRLAGSRVGVAGGLGTRVQLGGVRLPAVGRRGFGVLVVIGAWLVRGLFRCGRHGVPLPRRAPRMRPGASWGLAGNGPYSSAGGCAPHPIVDLTGGWGQPTAADGLRRDRLGTRPAGCRPRPLTRASAFVRKEWVVLACPRPSFLLAARPREPRAPVCLRT